MIASVQIVAAEQDCFFRAVICKFPLFCLIIFPEDSDLDGLNNTIIFTFYTYLIRIFYIVRIHGDRRLLRKKDGKS